MAVCRAREHNINVLSSFERWVASPFYIAARQKLLAPYMVAVEKMMRFKADLAHEFTKPLQMQNRLPKAQKRLLHRALEFVDAVGLEPQAADSYSFRVEGTRPNGRPLDLVGSKVGDTIQLTGDAAKTFTALRRTTNSFYTHMIRSAKAALGYSPDTPTSSITDEDERAFIQDLEGSRKKGYIPRMRVGDVKFSATFPDGRRHMYVAEPQGTDRLKIGKSRLDAAVAEANRIKASVKKKYGLKDDAFGPIETMEIDSIIGEVSKGNIESFEALMGAMLSPKALKELSVMDPETKQVVLPLKTMIKKMKEAKKAQSFKRTQIKREDIPGYLHDANFNNYFDNALTAYFLRGADFLASQYAAPDRAAALNDLAKNPNNVNLLNWARDHSNAISEPQSLAWMKGVAFHWALGANVSSAAINLTQVLHSTWPHLSMMAMNPLKSSAYLMNAFKDGARLFDRKGITGLEPDTMINLDKAKKILPKDEYEFIESLVRTGTIRPLMTEELADNNGRISYGFAYDQMSPYLRKAMNISTMMFSGVEQANRLTTALAAYRLYKADPKALQRAVKWRAENTMYGAEDPTPQNLARVAVEDTQGVITRENRSYFMRGDLSSVVFQFQQFPMMMMELMLRTMKFSDKKMAAMQMGLMTIGIMATAGFWGLPFAIPAKKLVEGISAASGPFLGNNPVSLDAPLRDLGIELGRLFGSDDPKMVGEYFTKGFVRAAGVDLSNRTALEIIPYDLFTGSAIDAAGPFAGLVVGGAVQAVQLHNAGYPHLAVASLFPLAIRNLAGGMNRLIKDTDAESYISPTTGRTQIPAGSSTPTERVLKAVGFTPARFARIREQGEAEGSQPAQQKKIAAQMQLAQALTAAALAQSDESRQAHEQAFEDMLESIQKHDEGQTDPRQRILLDPNEFMKGVASRHKQHLEGPLGPEAAKTRGNRKVQALNKERLKDIMPEIQ
jgi:hypothetical protein